LETLAFLNENSEMQESDNYNMMRRSPSYRNDEEIRRMGLQNKRNEITKKPPIPQVFHQ
jgi:hypothetical protein